jgi:hypothetical protein
MLGFETSIEAASNDSAQRHAILHRQLSHLVQHCDGNARPEVTVYLSSRYSHPRPLRTKKDPQSTPLNPARRMLALVGALRVLFAECGPAGPQIVVRPRFVWLFARGGRDGLLNKSSTLTNFVESKSPPKIGSLHGENSLSNDCDDASRRTHLTGALGVRMLSHAIRL